MKKTFFIILSLCITSCSYITSEDLQIKEDTQVSPYYNTNCKSSHNLPINDDLSGYQQRHQDAEDCQGFTD